VLYEEQVLDGAQRQQACEELGIEPRYDRPEIRDPIAYVIGQNERRRQLTKGQLARVASKIANMMSGARTDLEPGVVRRQVSLDKAAKALRVSSETVNRVRVLSVWQTPAPTTADKF
jgi:hypothetical protein